MSDRAMVLFCAGIGALAVTVGTVMQNQTLVLVSIYWALVSIVYKLPWQAAGGGDE